MDFGNHFRTWHRINFNGNTTVAWTIETALAFTQCYAGNYRFSCFCLYRLHCFIFKETNPGIPCRRRRKVNTRFHTVLHLHSSSLQHHFIRLRIYFWSIQFLLGIRETHRQKNCFFISEEELIVIPTLSSFETKIRTSQKIELCDTLCVFSQWSLWWGIQFYHREATEVCTEKHRRCSNRQ